MLSLQQALQPAVDEVLRLAKETPLRAGPYYNPPAPTGPAWQRSAAPARVGPYCTWDGHWISVHHWTGSEWRQALLSGSTLARCYPVPILWREMPERVRRGHETAIRIGRENMRKAAGYRWSPARRKILRHGAARGVDTVVSNWVKRYHPEIEVIAHPANWGRFNNSAGPLRNHEMLIRAGDSIVITGGREHITTALELRSFWSIFERIDRGLIAFPGGKGTADCVRQARENSVHVYFVSSVP